MELRISINNKALFVLLIVVAMVSAVGITLAQPPDPGHYIYEIGCGADYNIPCDNDPADGLIDYANFAGHASTADSAATVPWGGVDGVPAGFADGADNGLTGSHSSCAMTAWGTCTAGATAPAQYCPTGTFVAGYQRQGCSADGCLDSTRCERVRLWCCN